MKPHGNSQDSFVTFSKRLGKNQDVRRPIAHIVGDLPPPAGADGAGPDLLSLRQAGGLWVML